MAKLNYATCSNADLRKFIIDRRITVVVRSGLSNRTATRNDYLRALKKADAYPSFARFLHLPSELRNEIYANLLICQDSFSCSPQILATNKQINQEATGLFYGHNLIDIVIHDDGVYVHSSRCGTYTPLDTDLNDRKRSRDHEALIWPELLRRAQFLRFGVHHTAAILHAFHLCGQFNNILSSLCTFLLQGCRHKLRRFELLCTPLDPPMTGAFTCVNSFVNTDLSPLCMLGSMPELKVNGRLRPSGYGFDPTDPRSALEAMTRAMRAWARFHKSMLNDFHRLTDAVAAGRQLTNPDKTHLRFIHRMWRHQAEVWKSSGMSTEPHVMVLQATKALRKTTEMEIVPWGTRKFEKEVLMLLRREAELRILDREGTIPVVDGESR